MFVSEHVSYVAVPAVEEFMEVNGSNATAETVTMATTMVTNVTISPCEF